MNGNARSVTVVLRGTSAYAKTIAVYSGALCQTQGGGRKRLAVSVGKEKKMRMEDINLIGQLELDEKMTWEEAEIAEHACGARYIISSYNDTGSWVATNPKTADSIAVLVFDKVTIFLGK